MKNDKIVIEGNKIVIKQRITLNELAKFLGCSHPNAKYIMKNYLVCDKMGKSWIIEPQTFEKPKRGNPTKKTENFYTYENKVLTIDKVCRVKDLQRVLGVEYVTVINLLRRRNVTVDKDKNGRILIPTNTSIQLGTQQIKRLNFA